MTNLELRQYLEDMQVGLALRLDDLAGRIETIECGLAAIETLLGERRRVDPEFIAGRLGLTLAESRVAAMLAEGNTAHEIAEATERKITTVRWFMKQIYSKLGVSTQVQLVRRILMLTYRAGGGGTRSDE